MPTFLAPAFLFGLLAVAVPVILHLLFRRRVPVLDFPLMHLIERAERSRQPRRRLNRVLLLLLRMAILTLLALALARPLFGGRATLTASGPVALRLVVDDSLSMGAKDEDARTRLEVASEEASLLLSGLPPGSRVSGVSTGGGQELPWSSPEEAVEWLAQREVGLTRALLGPVLSDARRDVLEAPLPDARVVLLSDLARHGFEEAASGADAGEPVPLELVQPPPVSGVNRSVSGLDAEPLPDGRLGVTLRVSAWGGEAGEVPWTLTVAGGDEPPRVVARSSLSPGAGASKQRRLPVAVEPGHGWSELVLEEDFLPADDRRHVTHHLRARPRLLVVDGDPQNLSFGAETFYLERALAPGVALGYEADFITVAELDEDSLAGRDAVLLCNLPELGQDRLRLLQDRVEQGLGLLVSLGDRVVQAAYNGGLASLLPATVSVLQEPPAPAVPRPYGRVDLSRAKVHRWHQLLPDDDAQVTLRLFDGQPLMVEGRVGQGRVALLGTTLDRDWNDLPISPQFLGLLDGWISRLVDATDVEVLDPAPVGTRLELGLGGDRWLVGPDDQRSKLPEDGAVVVEQLGRHRVMDADGRVSVSFAGITDPAESDLARLSSAELPGALGPGLAVVTPEGDESRGGRPTWPLLLASLVLVAALESYIARRAA
ncbi:MAG: BatA domain-containing protein [Acidobacteriota bacterium]